jgi:hypothetical protein
VTILVKPDGRARFRLRISARAVIAFFFAIGVVEVVAGEGYGRRVLPTSGWLSWVVLGLTASPAVIACLPAAGVIYGGLWQRRTRNLVREDCQLAVLGALLLVLYGLRSAPCYRHISQRLDREEPGVRGTVPGPGPAAGCPPAFRVRT